MPDIRLDCSFLTHPKRQKLQRRIGANGVLAFIDLLLWISQDSERSQSGTMKCMDNEDIAIAAGWTGEPDTFVASLVEVRLIDEVEGNHYIVHNWARRQAYLAASSKRSEQAKAAASARWGGSPTPDRRRTKTQAKTDSCAQPAPGSSMKNDAASMLAAHTEHAPEILEHAPDPTRPDPTNKPTSLKLKDPQVWMVVEHYRRKHPQSLKGLKPTSKVWKKVRACLDSGYTAAELCEAIDGNHISPYHCGQNDTGTKYHSLELICRDSSKVDTFIDIARNPPKSTKGKPPHGYSSWEEYDETVRSLTAEAQGELL